DSARVKIGWKSGRGRAVVGPASGGNQAETGPKWRYHGSNLWALSPICAGIAPGDDICPGGVRNSAGKRTHLAHATRQSRQESRRGKGWRVKAGEGHAWRVASVVAHWRDAQPVVAMWPFGR